MSQHEIISLTGEEPQAELFSAEETVAVEPLPQEELDRLTDELIAAFKTVFDPEIPVDIYELGLIYRVDVNDNREVVVDMTLTAPGCPVAGEMPGWVQNAVMGVRGVADCTVNLVFEPPWESSKMSDEAKLQLNMF
ncbi:SUF system Fe-S cluster assembly protein [Asticcacaulis sp. BYS171W]|uniref:SUF system Fe-S cluster assembly protein n=1 Tax=Asticcacaulis aquaticus TaxID=2984212 RepID=A0ABT5HNS2_9CAUL|nr:SUF system Fe-S cluster assembly protein [Asticcacaulis aquaticus]MDC7681718.1 SUF system Fe-S cluster assembly protein [Asticcacaulis aquaticus]